jgi:hypothetical protein
MACLPNTQNHPEKARQPIYARDMRGESATLFMNLDETQAELIRHIQAVCAALAILRNMDLSNVVAREPTKEQGLLQMNTLISAHVSERSSRCAA